MEPGPATNLELTDHRLDVGSDGVSPPHLANDRTSRRRGAQDPAHGFCLGSTSAVLKGRARPGRSQGHRASWATAAFCASGVLGPNADNARYVKLAGFCGAVPNAVPARAHLCVMRAFSRVRSPDAGCRTTGHQSPCRPGDDPRARQVRGKALDVVRVRGHNDAATMQGGDRHCVSVHHV